MAIPRTKKTPQKGLSKPVQLPKRYAAFSLGTFIAALELVAKNWVTLVSGSRDGWTLFGEVKASATVKRRVMLRNGGAQAGPEAQISGDCSCGEAWCAHLCALALWVDAQAKGPADEKKQTAARLDPVARHSGTNAGTNAGANALIDQRRLVFLLRLEDDLGLCRLLPYVELQDAQPDRQRFFAYQSSPFALMQTFIREQDQAWLSALQATGYRLGADQARHLEAILEAGRCFHGVDFKAKALQPGPVRAIRHSWRLGPDGVQVLDWQGDRDEQLFLFPAPWYLDAAAGLCGPADTGLAPRLLELFTRHARILPEQLAEVRQAMLALMPELEPTPTEPEINLPQALEFRRLKGRHPSPVLRVGPAPKAIQAIECHLLFRYQGLLLPDTRTNSLLDAGEVVSIRRDARVEAALLEEIQHLFAVHPQNPFERQMTLEEWQTQGPGLLQRLRGLGWEIQQAADFEHRLLLAEDWRLELVQPDADRHGLLRLFCWHQVPGQGGEAAGDQRLDLLPLLRDNLAARHPLLEPQHLCLQPPESLLALRGQGQLIAVPAGLVKGLIGSIFELQAPARDAEGIPLSPARAASLRLALEAPSAQAPSAQAPSAQAPPAQAPSAQAPPVQPHLALGWQEPEFLAKLRVALQQKEQGEAQLPAGLECELRPYQRQGLAWLQLLARHGLGGVLADDMGLGKTLQCLALALWHKHQQPDGSTGPILVVAPKSLLGNWRAEARRFAPGLRVLVLDGPQRHLRFGEIPGQDLVVTSYPLVSRDQDALARQYFRALVLDESQWIKNPASQTAQAVRRIQAGHRLCLTGTPLENHLGELWAQFDFLMPGFLGGPNLFQRLVRDPIEKWGDVDTNQRLGRRLGPFMLRRTKAEVLPELPPKTEIPRYLDMGEDQQALYEQIRRHIYPELKEKLAAQGLKGSSISILDALLKLRQVCCDPRLVKGLGPMMSEQALSEQAIPSDTTSIKLDYLRELLPELVAEGRRILLFSQFTSMLALIEAELAALQIPHLKLTGQSRQRDELVAAFQRGDAPVFLISLKVGGTGLNLTAADTIIHYDPWWNPAIERQATDRAYRIGQDKPVFVYKLLCTGSVETRIQELQARKEALADNLLNASEGLASRWNEQDIDALFAPLDRP